MEEFMKMLANSANNPFLPKDLNLAGIEKQILIAEAKKHFNETKSSFEEGSKTSEATYEEWQSFLVCVCSKHFS